MISLVLALALTADQSSLLAEVDAASYIKARDHAEAILARSPDDFVACWAMARVQHDEEGNHARALYYVHRAEALLGDRDPEWDKKLLLEEHAVLFEMDRNQEALDVLDRYERRHGPPRAELRIWPLFKLGRTDDAVAIATKLAASEDWNDRAAGFNGMLSLLFEAHDRDGSYRWSVDGARATQDESCTILRNAAGAAFTRFRIAEAEDFALRAHKAKVVDCSDKGYDQLAGIYLGEGEFQKALAALKELGAQKIEKRYRPHYAVRGRMILVDLLYALDKMEEAERLAADINGLPPRTGMTSGTEAMERLTRALRYEMTLDGRIALEREKASYRPLLAGVGLDVPRLIMTRWEVRRALIQMASDADTLVVLARPNLGEITDFSAWRAGALIDIVGTGVMAAATALARAADVKYPEATAYLDALAGEIAWRAGDLVHADELAGQALAGLPREEALLRWRTQAWQADTRRRLGRPGDARPLYQEVLARWPTAFRILDLRLPVTVVGEGPAASRLARSARFLIEDGAPFRVTVSVRDGLIDACLTDENGTQFACGGGKKDVSEALDAFHAAAFAPKVSVTQSDLSSLDGSPVRESADDALKGVLSP
jgi:hypothetical protein